MKTFLLFGLISLSLSAYAAECTVGSTCVADACHLAFCSDDVCNTTISVCPSWEELSESHLGVMPGSCDCVYNISATLVTVRTLRGANCMLQLFELVTPVDICKTEWAVALPLERGYDYVCDPSLNAPYGLCVYPEANENCTTNTDCNDYNECTDDSCDVTTGRCKYDPGMNDRASCNSGAGICFDGRCAPIANYTTCEDCCTDDANCTTDSQCVYTKCSSEGDCLVFPLTTKQQYIRNPAEPVVYWQECTTDEDPQTYEVCFGGVCTLLAIIAPVDETTCMWDMCIAGDCALGLTVTFAYPDDGNECTHVDCPESDPTDVVLVNETGTLCSLGRCLNGTCMMCKNDAECDDENECTSERCDNTTVGCIYTILRYGTPCTAPENKTGICQYGVCVALPPPVLSPKAIVGIVSGATLVGLLLVGLLLSLLLVAGKPSRIKRRKGVVLRTDDPRAYSVIERPIPPRDFW